MLNFDPNARFRLRALYAAPYAESLHTSFRRDASFRGELRPGLRRASSSDHGIFDMHLSPTPTPPRYTAASTPLPPAPQNLHLALMCDGDPHALHQLAAEYIGCPINVLAYSTLKTFAPRNTSQKKPAILLHEEFGAYRLRGPAVAMPAGYAALASTLRGTESLVLHVLCGARAIPLQARADEMMRQLHKALEDIAAMQCRSADAVHQSPQRPPQKSKH